MDKELQAPCIKQIDDNNNDIYLSESFLEKSDDKNLVTHNYNKRLVKIENDNINKYINFNAYAAICPDFLLN